jgi:hypothetical protein
MRATEIKAQCISVIFSSYLSVKRNLTLSKY